jgi:hypothetical protein
MGHPPILFLINLPSGRGATLDSCVAAEEWDDKQSRAVVA